MRAWKKVEILANKMINSEQPKDERMDDSVFLFYFFSRLKLDRPPFVELRKALSIFFDGPARSLTSGKVMRALQLLEVELKQYEERSGSSQTCLNELGRIQRDVSVKGDEAARHESLLWWRRVTMSMVNTAVRMGSWSVALALLEKLRRRATPGTPQFFEGVESLSSVQSKVAYEVEVLSRIGKVFLQMGNLDGALRFFNYADACDKTRMQIQPGIERSSRCLLNYGLLSFAQSQYREAMETFNVVIEAERRHQGERQFAFGQAESSSSAKFSASTSSGEDPLPVLFCGLDNEENVMVSKQRN
jgi:tetratricopeptide (TPR) repeat protein